MSAYTRPSMSRKIVRWCMLYIYSDDPRKNHREGLKNSAEKTILSVAASDMTMSCIIVRSYHAESNGISNINPIDEACCKETQGSVPAFARHS